MLLTEMKLPEVDIYSKEYLEDVHGLAARLRKESWIVKYNYGYMLLDLEPMKYFLASDQCRQSNRDVTKLLGMDGDTSFARFNNNFMQSLEGEAHAKMRSAVNKAFTPKAANLQRELMRETLHKVLDELGSSGECDFVELAINYPITVMCRMPGVHTDDIKEFEGWLESMAYLTSAEKVTDVDDALKNMFNYAERLVEERRKPENRQDDLLQTLVDMGAEGDQINEEDMLILIVHLIAGGYDTVKNQLVMMLKVVCDFPDQQPIIENDRSKIKPFIEECLRYLNPIGMEARVANVDIEYRGITIPKDTLLQMPVTVAGRDESANEDPDKFDIDRKQKNHCAWGYGVHMCLGMFLAKALLEEGMDIILDRMKNIRPAAEPEMRPYGPVWGYATLPITFDPVGRTLRLK